MVRAFSGSRGLSRFVSCSVSVIAFLALRLPAAASITFNGSFENVGGASSSFSINYGPDAPDNILAGWTATPSGNKILDCVVFPGATTDLCGTNAFGGNMSFWVNPGPSPDGGNYVAIDGDPNFETPLQQSLTGLTIGAQYDVSFYQAAAQQHGFDGATTEQWKVVFGSQIQFSTLMNNANHSDVGWMSQTLSFTATAVNQVLSFIAVGTPSGEPPFVLLDGVSVVDPPGVPEPETDALVGIGLLSIPIVRKLRKKRL